MSLTTSPIEVKNDFGFNVVGGNCTEVDLQKLSISHKLKQPCRAFCFGDKCLTIDKPVFIKISEVSRNAFAASGLTIGVTSCDPTKLAVHDLPKQALPKLGSDPRFALLRLGPDDSKVENVIHLKLLPSGLVNYGVNGVSKGFLDRSCGLDVRVFLDLSGLVSDVEFLADADETKSDKVVSQPVNSPQMNVSSTSTPLPQAYVTSSEVRQNKTYSGYQRRLMGCSLETIRNTALLYDIKNFKVNQLTPSSLHAFTGNSVQLGQRDETSVALRKKSAAENGFVFAANPLRKGEKICVKAILCMDGFASNREFSGLGFGLTTSNPSVLQRNRFVLPENPRLLARQQYFWVYFPNLTKGNTPIESGEELAFWFDSASTRRGEYTVKYSRNGATEIIGNMVVNSAQPLYCFFDLRSTVESLRVLGTTFDLRSAIAIPPVNAPASVDEGTTFHLQAATVTPVNAPTVEDPPVSAPTNVEDVAAGLAQLPLSGYAGSVLLSAVSRRAPAVVAAAPVENDAPTPTAVSEDVPSVNEIEVEAAAVEEQPGVVCEEAAAPKAAEVPPDEPDDRECIICMDAPTEVVVIPCGHTAFCEKCIKESLKKGKHKVCPICRTKVQDYVRLQFNK